MKVLINLHLAQAGLARVMVMSFETLSVELEVTPMWVGRLRCWTVSYGA